MRQGLGLQHSWAPHLHFRLPPEPSRLLRARERIRDYLQQNCYDKRVIDELVLCIEEAATNAIRHSGSAEPIEIDLGFESDDLVAKVKDEGRGFDVEAFDPERQPDLLSTGGRGLFLIASLTDEMGLHRNGGLEVRMVRKAVVRCDTVAVESGLGDASAASDLVHRETRLRAMLEEIGEGFLALNWEYRIVHVNEAALRLTGKSRDELLDRRPWEVLSTMAGTVLEQAYRDAMELGRPSLLEHRSVVTGDWLEVRLYPTLAGISVYFREINERKRIEEEVLSSREQLAATRAAITDGFYTLDREWRVTYLNDRAAAVFQRSKEQVLGHNYFELFPEIAGTDFERNERAAMEQGEFRSGESYYAPFDAWYEERDYPSADGITVLFTDISERKRAEKEREKLLVELRTQSELLQAQSRTLQVQTKELAERVDLAEALNAINRLVHSTLDFDEISQRALEEGVRALAVDAGTIEMREASSWVVRYQSGFRAEDVGRRLSDAEALNATRALMGMEPVAVTDMRSDHTLNVGFVRGYGLRSVLAVPMIVRQSVIGCLLFYGKGVRSFSEAEIDFARKLGATVSL